jgi:hypothetical protein
MSDMQIAVFRFGSLACTASTILRRSLPRELSANTMALASELFRTNSTSRSV